MKSVITYWRQHRNLIPAVFLLMTAAFCVIPSIVYAKEACTHPKRQGGMSCTTPVCLCENNTDPVDCVTYTLTAHRGDIGDARFSCQDEAGQPKKYRPGSKNCGNREVVSKGCVLAMKPGGKPGELTCQCVNYGPGDWAQQAGQTVSLPDCTPDCQ